MAGSEVSLLILYHCVGRLGFIHSFSIVMSNTDNVHILKKRENCFEELYGTNFVHILSSHPPKNK